MTTNQHIAHATAHLIAAISGSQTAHTDDLRGAPIIEFDSGGQEVFYALERLVGDKREAWFGSRNATKPEAA